MTTKPPDFGDAPWPERDPEVPYDHERAAKEFLDAADRICSATIGVGEALLAMLQELRSRSKEEKKGSRSKKGPNVQSPTRIKIPEEVKGETSDRSPVLERTSRGS
jgi:hypothetical protein